MLKRSVLFGTTILISLAAAHVQAAPFTIPGDSATTAKTLNAGETGTVQDGASLSVSGGSVAVTMNGNGATINNLGTIAQTGSGRAVRDGTNRTGLAINNGSATDSNATISSTGDDTVQIRAGSTVTVHNYGTIKVTGASGQALDFATITGANTVNNYSTGVIQTGGADGVRPGVNGVVNNAGTIQVTGSGDGDGVDLQTNTGIVVNNLAGGLISGLKHGVGGGYEDPTNAPFTVTVNNAAGAIILGNGASGINIDGFNANQTATITNHGTITGAGGLATRDGDGIDIDGTATIINTGVIQSLNAQDFTVNPDSTITPASSEGISFGGGSITNSGTIQGLVTAPNPNAIGRGITLAGIDIGGGARENIYANAVITNQAGGLISGQHDSGIFAFNTGTNSGFTVTVNNNAGATIQGGGATAAIRTGADNDTINNAGTINGASSGKAISTAGGDDTVNLSTGSNVVGSLDGGTGNDALNLNGTGAIGSTSGFESLSVQGGTWTLTGDQSYGTGTVSNGGVLKTDPTTITFTTLTIEASGALEGEAGDIYQINGDFYNHSTQANVWNTTDVALAFTGASGTTQNFLLTGSDLGATYAGVSKNFAWLSLGLDDGNVLSLGNGLGAGSVALYVSSVIGFDIVAGAVQNVLGNGFNIYYERYSNPDLGGLTYALGNGGALIAYEAPAPEAWTLMLAGFAMIASGRWLRRARRHHKA